MQLVTPDSFECNYDQIEETSLAAAMRYGLIYQATSASVSREKKYLISSRDGRTYMFNFHTFFVNFFIASNIHPSIHTHTHTHTRSCHAIT